MITETELLLERRRLRRRLGFWRIAALLLVLAVILVAAAASGGSGSRQAWKDQIARVRISGIINGDQPTLDLLDEIIKADHVKAVLVAIDSPGGSTAGSEALYEKLREVAAKKPLVATMENVAASGGYITAISADYIVARGNTITGSIGVIFSMPEFSGLLAKVGVQMEEVKSGPLKAEPSPYAPMSDAARAVTAEMVADSFDWFTGLVAERRKIPLAQVKILADGRVYTGRQAVKNKLIDALGGEEVATAWLEDERKIAKDLPVVDWEAEAPAKSSIFGTASGATLLNQLGLGSLSDTIRRAGLDGLVSVWHP